MIQVNKDAFLEKIIVASNFVSQKYGGTNPILQGILLEGEDNKLKISSTNLNQYFQTTINIVIKKKFKIIIEPQKIIEFLSLLESGDVEIEVGEKKIIIKRKKTEGSFPLLTYEDYPSLPKKPEKTQEIKTNELTENINKIIFSVSKDETRPVLSGVYFNSDEKNLFLVATDGFRLSLLKTKKQVEIPNSIIPASFLNNVLKIVKKETISLGFNSEEKTVFLKSGDDIFISRLIEGDYPQYERVIPQKTTTRVFVNADELLRAVKLIAVFARDQSNIVVLEINKNNIVLRPKTETKEGKTEIDTKTEGDPITIAFNFKFIVDFLRSVSNNKKQITMAFSRPDSPASFTLEGEDDYLHIIMPVRIQE